MADFAALETNRDSKRRKIAILNDGLQVENEKGPDQYFFGTCDWELAGACLDAAASKLQ